jgi:hypothetical protein
LPAPAGVLAACVPADPEEPGPETGSPGAELDVFYEQELVWEGCADHPTTAGEAGLPALAPAAECARMEVPLGYEKPGGETASVVVTRVPARGDSRGSVVYTRKVRAGPGSWRRCPGLVSTTVHPV